MPNLNTDPITVDGAGARATPAASSGLIDLRGLAPAALVDHIREQHDLNLRATVPFIPPLAGRVACECRGRDPHLDELRDTTIALRRLLESHLDQEEDDIFRAIRGGHTPASAKLIALRAEHREIGATLDRLRALTHGYRAPSWACPRYRTLLDWLRALDREIVADVGLEDHALASVPCVP